MRSLIALALGTASLLAVPTPVVAEPHAFHYTDVCRNFRLKQPDPAKVLGATGEDLEVYCPGDTTPWITFHGCPKASMTKNTLGDTVYIICPGWPAIILTVSPT